MSDSDSNLHANSKKILQNKELIELVRERKCLWDRTAAEYKDRVAKDKAWADIYRKIDPSYESLNHEQRNQVGGHITRKWYNIRDSYVKSMKSNRSRNRPYIYAEGMRFLDSTYLNESGSIKRRKNTFKDERMSNEDADYEYDGSANWMSEVYVDMEHEGDPETQDKSHNSEYSPVPKEIPEVDDHVVSILANLIQKEEDEDRAFFKSITPAVKNLSEHSKFVFRIQVMKLLNNLKIREKKKKVPMKRGRAMSSDSDTE